MGKYILHERIGAGGMAEVLRATYCPEGGFEKVVAVKRILPAFSDDPEFVTMFREEARICAMLQHPNLVQVFDVGLFEGSYFLAMEYVDGLPLHWLIRGAGGRLPIPAVTFIGAELAAALAYIHTRTSPDGTPLHLVHRDLNPPNILISRFGEVKLTDFGVAQAAVRASVTRAGFVRGKLSYLAPEQLEQTTLDGRADLFALGLTLHEALTGEHLLTGNTYEAIRQSMKGPFAPPSRTRPDVPPELDTLLLQLLDPAPDRRPASGAAVLRGLQALPPVAAPFPTGKPLLAEAVERVRAVLDRGVPAPPPQPTAETPPLHAPRPADRE
jgi:serine/threonine-protein kinase